MRFNGPVFKVWERKPLAHMTPCNLPGVTSLQLRYIHESILPLLRQHGVSKIFGDDTDLPKIQADDQAWIVSDRMLRAIAADLRKGASKTAAAYFGKLSVGNVQARTPEGLTIRAFDSVANAKAWLRDNGAEPGHR